MSVIFILIMISNNYVTRFNQTSIYETSLLLDYIKSNDKLSVLYLRSLLFRDQFIFDQ